MDRAISMGPDTASAYGYKVQLYLSWHGSTARAEQVLEDAASRIEREVLDTELWALGHVFLGSSDTLADYLDQAETAFTGCWAAQSLALQDILVWTLDESFYSIYRN